MNDKRNAYGNRDQCDKTNDWKHIDLNELDSFLMSSDALLVGSPTINQNTLLPVYKLFALINPIRDRGKLAGSFGSYGWSGEAVTNIDERLKQLRFKIPMTGLKIVFNPSEDQQEEALAFGKYFATFIKTNHPIA